MPAYARARVCDVNCHALSGPEAVDMFEFFAGQKAVSKAFQRRRFRVCSYEILDNPVLYDFLSPSGFAHALSVMLKMPRGGFVMAAPVCSSWARTLYRLCCSRCV